MRASATKLQVISATIIGIILACALPLHAGDAHSQTVHLRGTLIDTLCWNSPNGDPVRLLREHSKACMQMPDCARSGYVVVKADGKVYKLDAASNGSATKWIAATARNSDWRVDVTGRVFGGLLNVTKIQLQK